MRRAWRGAFLRGGAASSRAVAKNIGLPSLNGTSGPSISAMALSRPKAAKADSRCSTVETLTPCLLERTVQRRVSDTLSQRAGMVLGRFLISVRIKVTPEKGGAG